MNRRDVIPAVCVLTILGALAYYLAWVAFFAPTLPPVQDTRPGCDDACADWHDQPEPPMDWAP